MGRCLRPEVRDALNGVITYYRDQEEEGAIGWDLLDAERLVAYTHHWIGLDAEAEQILGPAFSRFAEEFASSSNDVIGVFHALNHFQTDRQLVGEIGKAPQVETDYTPPLVPLYSDDKVEEVRIWTITAKQLARQNFSSLARRALSLAASLFQCLISDIGTSERNYLALQLATAWVALGELGEAENLSDSFGFPRWQRSPCYEQYAMYLARSGRFSEALVYAGKNTGIDEENKEWFARVSNHALLIYIAELYSKSSRPIEAFGLLMLLWKQVKNETLPLWILPRIIQPMVRIGFGKEAVEILRDVLAWHQPPYEDYHTARVVSTIFHALGNNGVAYENLPVAP